MKFKIEHSLALNVFLFDQLTKLWAKKIGFLKITPFLNFSLGKNFGTTFGFFQCYDCWVHSFIFCIILAIFVFALYLFAMARHQYERIGYSLIIGGAMGNILDRFMDGYVTDFIQFHIGNWYYPTFNIADSFIVMGVLILFLAPMFPSLLRYIDRNSPNLRHPG